MKFIFSDKLQTRRRFLESGLAGLTALTISPLIDGPEIDPPVSNDASSQNRVRFTVLDGRACRPCRSFMDRFITRHRSELSRCFPDGAEIFFIIGKEHRIIPPRSIVVGECPAFLGEKAALHAPGCPPTERDARGAILRAWKEFSRTENPENKTTSLFGKG